MIKGLREIAPYVAGSQPMGDSIIKLNTNENAYGPSPEVAATLQTFQAGELRKYSTLDQEKLRLALAEQHDISADQIIIGNGSDDILSMAFLAFFNSEVPIFFPDLTYGFYKVWADLYHVPYREIPLNKDFEWEVADYCQKNGGIILTNPNAPTGIYKSLAEIETVIVANPDSVVIIDEAYINFGGETALPLLKRYDNVFITRTFSKDASLAGVRLGYGIGSPNLIAVINAVNNAINPYNVNLISERLGCAAVASWSYYEDSCRKIIETREWFTAQLRELAFEVLPSQTNFVLVSPVSVSASQLFTFLQEKEIYVRYFPKVERLKNYLRISIGTRDEMTAVVREIRSYLAEATQEN